MVKNQAQFDKKEEKFPIIALRGLIAWSFRQTECLYSFQN
jgi:hypothetical protein